jgi:hypothetical protein
LSLWKIVVTIPSGPIVRASIALRVWIIRRNIIVHSQAASGVLRRRVSAGARFNPRPLRRVPSFDAGIDDRTQASITITSGRMCPCAKRARLRGNARIAVTKVTHCTGSTARASAGGVVAPALFESLTNCIGVLREGI